MLDQTLGTKVVIAQAGSTYRVVNDRVTFKAIAADTNGAYSLFEMRTDPRMGTPPQRQRYADAAFWVLEGVYTFLLDSQQVRLGAGDYAYVPRGWVHAYTNSGDGPARMLVLVTPGGIHERFFTEAGELIEDQSALPTPGSPPDLLRLISVAQKYGIEVLPPAAT